MESTIYTSVPAFLVEDHTDIEGDYAPSAPVEFNPSISRRIEEEFPGSYPTESNAYRIAEVEQHIYETENGNETLRTPLSQNILFAFLRGLSINPQPYFLLLSIVRWILLSVLISYAVYYQNCVDNNHTDFDQGMNCSGYKFGVIASGMFSFAVLTVDIGLTYRYGKKLGSTTQVQQYVSEMCSSPPKLFYTAECYHNTRSDDSTRKCVTHFDSKAFQFQSYTDHTIIPSNLTAYDFVIIHGVIEYTFANPALAHRFEYEKQLFYHQHLHCDSHRNCSVNVTIGRNFATEKLCCLQSDAMLPAARKHRQTIHLICTLFFASWFYMVYEEGVNGHIYMVFKKEIVN